MRYFQWPSRVDVEAAVLRVVGVIVLILAAGVLGFAFTEHVRHPNVTVSDGEMCVNGWNGYHACISRHDDDYVQDAQCAMDGICSHSTASR
jgi:hypothetical protein